MDFYSQQLHIWKDLSSVTWAMMFLSYYIIIILGGSIMDDYLFSMCQTPVPDIAKGLENKYNRPVLKLYGVLHLE